LQGDRLPRRKYGRLRKKITYAKPEDCPVCKKGIYCPIHPDNRLDCKHHKLQHIIKREERLMEEEKKRQEEKKKSKKDEKKEGENTKAKKLWS